MNVKGRQAGKRGGEQRDDDDDDKDNDGQTKQKEKSARRSEEEGNMSTARCPVHCACAMINIDKAVTHWP